MSKIERLCGLCRTHYRFGFAEPLHDFIAFVRSLLFLDTFKLVHICYEQGKYIS